MFKIFHSDSYDALASDLNNFINTNDVDVRLIGQSQGRDGTLIFTIYYDVVEAPTEGG